MGKRAREDDAAVASMIKQEYSNGKTPEKKPKLKDANAIDSDDVQIKKKKSKKRKLENDKISAMTKTPDKTKADRKAERKMLKAENEPVVGINGSSTSEGIERSDELTTAFPDDRAARKAEKKRLKALKKDSGIKDIQSSGSTQAQVFAISNGTTQSSFYAENVVLSSLPQSDIDEYLSKHSITITDPASTAPLRPITAFSQLPKSAIRGPSPFTKFTSPTPIQAATWPFILSGRDMIGIAETGSGKTLAFGIPLIQHVTTTKTKTISRLPARAVIVSPTRELAVQIHEQIGALAQSAGFKTVCIYGGVPKEPQKEGLKTASVIIATPGRLNDLIEEGSANISEVDYLVLDEADRMLDKGFEEEIKRIISGTLPTDQRQTLMFTATWPQSVRTLAGTFMKDPVKITIGDHADGELRANTRIEQRVEVLDTHPRTKEQRLLQLLKELQPQKSKTKTGDTQANRVLIFALYKKEAARIEQFLQQRGHNVAGIHGDLSQERRTAALTGFRLGNTPLLVATDVAARGLDIPAVKAVVNLTFPLTVEDYVHRIGRTGRAGAHGLAITFFTEHDKALAGGLVNVLRAANQAVPEELLKFGGTVKKKQHDAYGAFYKAPVGNKKATKVKFDD